MSKKDALSAMLEQYQTNSETKNNQVKKYDLKNYFSTHLGPKETTATKRIRILPTTDDSTPFKEIYGHKVQVEGEWKTFICLKHEAQQDCPFCEANDALRATGNDAQKELAKKYSAKKMYVVKVIDRDNEKDGIKFWRFNHDYRKQGILDKIFGILQAVQKDITNPETGRDLLIILARDQNNRPAVQTISHLDPTPLNADKALEQEWLSDERTWKDVYAIKPYEFLEIIVKGGVPVWDKIQKKFVDKISVMEKEKNDVAAEDITIGVPNVKPNITVSTSPALPVVTNANDYDDDGSDLPF